MRTRNNNYLVKVDGLFGFFSTDGKLLREAKEKEWEWAESRMDTCEPEIVFDVDALKGVAAKRIEEAQKLRETSMQNLISFTGLTQEQVQNILDKCKIQPEELKISGQMSVDRELYSVSTGGCFYTQKEWVNVFGIFSSGEIVEINNIINLNAGQNANGSCSDGEGYDAEYLVSIAPEAKFFIVNSGHHYLTDHSTYNEIDDNNDWKIFSRPDLSALLTERRENILRDVKAFFENIRGVKNPAYLFDNVVERIGIGKPEHIVFGEMPENWSGITVSSGGCAYSDSRWCNVWAVNPGERIVKMDDDLVDEEAEQKADGSWASSRGYDVECLMEQAPKALFFVVNEGRERRADRQPSIDENTWSFLYPISELQTMIRNNNSKNKVPISGI